MMFHVETPTHHWRRQGIMFWLVTTPFVVGFAVLLDVAFCF